MPPFQKPGRVYTDNSREFIKACQDLPWTHVTNTHHRLGTNGIAERVVRLVKEGTATAMFQSGLPEQWWDCAMERYCSLRNVHDKTADGKTDRQTDRQTDAHGPNRSIRQNMCSTTWQSDNNLFTNPHRNSLLEDILDNLDIASSFPNP